eukprot:521781-Amphidinium_carterae.2
MINCITSFIAEWIRKVSSQSAFTEPIESQIGQDAHQSIQRESESNQTKSESDQCDVKLNGQSVETNLTNSIKN